METIKSMASRVLFFNPGQHNETALARAIVELRNIANGMGVDKNGKTPRERLDELIYGDGE